ncbi:hypothetical protein B7463_g10043, partial [Scytalidium lignicola]
MAAIIFKHKGDFNSQTKENRALRFVHKYIKAVTSDLSLPYPDTKFYAPSAIFYDTTNVTYTGAEAIKTWMLKLFSPFDKVELRGMSFVVIDETTETGALYTATVETMVKFFVKGDPEPILVPRLFVFEIRDSVSDNGFDGLQFFNVKLYWDTALLLNEIKRRREERGEV